MYRIKNKKSHDHGENHQGVDRQENQCYRFHTLYIIYIIVIVCTIGLCFFTKVPKPSFIRSRKVRWSGTGIAVDGLSQVRAASSVVKKALGFINIW